ncbi:MAG TPA: tetratricopeptide repeat protein, partial [Pirellula sp.]|nr:tetratricopeptide repeat protein [Pirellula sp.]
MATVFEALAIATQLHRNGRFQEAEQVYLKILAAVPNQLDAVYFLGILAQQNGKYQASVAYLQRTVELRPDHAEAYNNLGIGLAALAKLDEAIASYRRALELRPDYAKALDNMGNALQDLGKLDEAIANYRRSLDIKPDSAPTYNNLGTAWAERGNQDEAAACYRRSLALNPVFGEAHHNLGNALRSQGKLEEAIESYRCALEHDPNKPKGYNVLGLCLAEQRKLDEAIECYRRALELTPDCLSTLGSLIHGMQLACFWDSLDELSHRLLDLLDEDFGAGPSFRKRRQLSHRLNEQLSTNSEINDFSLQPFFLLSLPIVTSAKMQLQCAQRWAEKELKTSPVVLATPKRYGAAKRKSRTTIGYLSADYHNHPVGLQIGEMLEKHNRDRFEVIGYSLGRDDGSTTRRRLKSAFDRFVDVRHMSIEQAAKQIVTDGVDILVDLMGYTQDARTEILALRPAPIQVSYLGYPSSTGASFIDYILVDDYVVPLDQQPFFTEKLVTMPGCFLVNDSQRQIAQSTPSRSECNLPESGFVFCCFNN